MCGWRMERVRSVGARRRRCPCFPLRERMRSRPRAGCWAAPLGNATLGAPANRPAWTRRLQQPVRKSSRGDRPVPLPNGSGWRSRPCFRRVSTGSGSSAGGPARTSAPSSGKSGCRMPAANSRCLTTCAPSCPPEGASGSTRTEPGTAGWRSAGSSDARSGPWSSWSSRRPAAPTTCFAAWRRTFPHPLPSTNRCRGPRRRPLDRGGLEGRLCRQAVPFGRPGGRPRTAGGGEGGRCVLVRTGNRRGRPLGPPRRLRLARRAQGPWIWSMAPLRRSQV